MEQIKFVTAKALYLPGDDIDTDRIIPARFLRYINLEKLEKHVFEDDRKQLKGQHPFDQQQNQGASILICEVNFGCGSSREHAVHALTRWGIKAIIAQSFNEIFQGNSIANGLVLVKVSSNHHQQIVRQLEQSDENDELTIDLESMTVSIASTIYPCTMPEAHREMLLTGTWDTTAILLAAGEKIETTAYKLPYMNIPMCDKNQSVIPNN